VQIFGEFRGISQIWEATSKQMKILVLSANAL